MFLCGQFLNSYNAFNDLLSLAKTALGRMHFAWDNEFRNMRIDSQALVYEITLRLGSYEKEERWMQETERW